MMSRLLWMIAQASLIIWLTIEMHEDNPDNHLGGHLLVSVIFVAFLTAIIINSYDWCTRVFRACPYYGRFLLLVFWLVPTALILWDMTKKKGDLAGWLIVPSLSLGLSMLVTYLGTHLLSGLRRKVARVTGRAPKICQPQRQRLRLRPRSWFLGELPEERKGLGVRNDPR